MKRFVYIVVIILVLCVATFSFVKYADSERDRNRSNDGVQPRDEFLTDNPHVGAPPLSKSSTNAPYTSKSSEDILLINTKNPLPKDYRPEKLVNLYNQRIKHFQLAKTDIEVSEDVYQAMDAMFAAAQKDGVRGFIITSGYRSRGEQKMVFSISQMDLRQNPARVSMRLGLPLM
ncbi:hypothetical protein N752_30915 [Desulforamulus aquiferis]|nr:hypothetical protein N752_30915 [Desulforamulus aquiferis]